MLTPPLTNKASQSAEICLKNRKGCIIVSDIQSGKIFACVSSKESSHKQSKSTHIHYAHQYATYPASLFKVIIIAFALEKGLIQKEDTFFCSGRHYIERWFHCWLRTGHHHLSIKQALAYSCNLLFYQLVNKISINDFWCFLENINLNNPVCHPLDFPKETPPYIPKDRFLNQHWSDLDTANLMIGQGYLQVTPLQILTALNGIINGGRFHKPYIKKQKQPLCQYSFKQSNTQFIKEALWMTVNDPYGTAKKVKITEKPIGGKTGTAQVFPSKDTDNNKHQKVSHHSWFYSFYPVNEPKISILTFVPQWIEKEKSAVCLSQKLWKLFLQ